MRAKDVIIGTLFLAASIFGVAHVSAEIAVERYIRLEESNRRLTAEWMSDRSRKEGNLEERLYMLESKLRELLKDKEA